MDYRIDLSRKIANFNRQSQSDLTIFFTARIRGVALNLFRALTHIFVIKILKKLVNIWSYGNIMGLFRHVYNKLK